MKGKKNFSFIDLFAGIGGFHIAMHKAGGECVFASEIDKFARQTYEANFRQWSPELFSNGNFNEDITDPDLNYSEIPDFDVLCAGFPCQPFSHAGLKKGFNDTRGTLFFNIEQIVKTKIDLAEQGKAVIPKVLVLENVKGLVGHDKGNTFRVINDNLEELGYKVNARVLNSKNFGVPQNRERIFIVAYYHEIVKPQNDKFKFPVGVDKDDNPVFEDEIRPFKNINVGSVLMEAGYLNKLEKDAEKTYTISERLWAGHQRRRREHKVKGNGFGYSLFRDDSPYTSTISARYYKDGSEVLIDQSHLNKRPRKLHPIEAALLQGYPADPLNRNGFLFKIPVSDNQAYKQFGNSVSVPVVSTLAKEIKKQLLL